MENYPDHPFDESTIAQYMLHVWVEECSRESSATPTPDKSKGLMTWLVLEYKDGTDELPLHTSKALPPSGMLN